MKTGLMVLVFTALVLVLLSWEFYTYGECRETGMSPLACLRLVLR